jgi:hypothetical protein
MIGDSGRNVHPQILYDMRRTRGTKRGAIKKCGQYFGEEEYEIDPIAMKEFGLVLLMEIQSLAGRRLSPSTHNYLPSKRTSLVYLWARLRLASEALPR